jgi:hypothetical protein
MAVGLPAKTTYVDGDVFSASDINDTNGTLNLVGQTTNFYAGKNKIINGNFGIWQRGTSFTVTGAAYTADRFRVSADVAVTVSRQTFTPGTAPVAGYEGEFFHRTTCAATTASVDLAQFIEDVRTFAGQTVTLSFWAKANVAATWTVFARQNFGSGGSANVDTAFASTASLTTSWQRFSLNITIPAVTGKTIGASSYLGIIGYIVGASANSKVLDFWGVQVEAGSTATAFQTATGTIQGELAACQRYYFRALNSAVNSAQIGGIGFTFSATAGVNSISLPVEMRIVPTSLDYANLRGYDITAASVLTVTSAAISSDSTRVVGTFTYVLVSGTANRMLRIDANNSSGYLGFSAEL